MRASGSFGSGPSSSRAVGFRFVVLFCCLASPALVGCQWIADAELDPNVRVHLEQLERPMPLDQPFDDGIALRQIAHPRVMQALIERLEEFGDGLADPNLRAAYAKSLAGGGPSRTQAFCELCAERSIPAADQERLLAAWDRIDDGLAAEDAPEFVEERLLALSALVQESDPSAPSRLTEAIRDDWNPESENWSRAISAIENPTDPAWDVAWSEAAKKDLGDSLLGKALLEELSWPDAQPAVHPFASPKNLEWLCGRMRESRDEDELLHLSGQFRSLDPASVDVLFQAAMERPVGNERLHCAFEAYRRTRSDAALAEMKAALADERLAFFAIERLSRCGQIDGVELPTGEALARAKAYFAVSHNYGFDDEIRQTTLVPLVSGKVKHEGEEFEVSLFRYAMPPEVAEAASTSDDAGLAIVDDGVILYPDETSASFDESSTEAFDAEAIPAFQQSFQVGAIRTLRDEGCRTFLDLIAAIDVPNGRREDRVAFERNDTLKTQLLAEDERWKTFDVPFESLGFEIPEEEEGSDEPLAPSESK